MLFRNQRCNINCINEADHNLGHCTTSDHLLLGQWEQVDSIFLHLQSRDRKVGLTAGLVASSITASPSTYQGLRLLWKLPAAFFPDIFSCIPHLGFVEPMPEFLFILSWLFGGSYGVLMSLVPGLMQVFFLLWKPVSLGWKAHIKWVKILMWIADVGLIPACLDLTCLSQIVNTSVVLSPDPSFGPVLPTEILDEAEAELLLQSKCPGS